MGAIADDKIVGTPAEQEVHRLLEGIPLAQAAPFPDAIKDWDKKGPDAGGFRIESHPEIQRQLLAFVKANPNQDPPPAEPAQATVPSHHWFHYSDVPVIGDETYESGKAGRSPWDIEHMIDYCIRVLRGEEPADNARAITKPVALILLAHYLGDIHQPLHVGADYFDKAGQATNPDKGAGTLGDAGGNSIFLLLKEAPPGTHWTLHGFWDTPAVLAAFAKIAKDGQINETGDAKTDIPVIAKYLAAKEPTDWKIPSSVPLDKVGIYLADNILPTARAAHERLVFSSMAPEEKYGETLEGGFASERAMPDGAHYFDWAAAVTASQLDRAGWRLADILERIFPGQTASPQATPASK